MVKEALKAIDVYKMRSRISDEDIASEMNMTRRNYFYIKKSVNDGKSISSKNEKLIFNYCEKHKIDYLQNK